MANGGRPRLGELLIQTGFITEEHIKIALQVQKIRKQYLGETLKNLGFISSKELAIALAKQSGFSYINLEEIFPPKEAVFLLEKREAKMLNAICIDVDEQEKRAVVVIDDPYDLRKHSTIRSRLKNYKVEFRVAEEDKLEKFREIFYSFYTNPLDKQIEEEINKFTGGGGDIVKLVNMILDFAIILNASDIHFNPLADVSFLFFRIDGILHSMFVLPLFIHNNIVSRIKLISGMNVAERRIPQDGAFSYQGAGESVDIRVSTLPTAFGEKVVMRILRKDISKLNILFLGYTDFQLEKIREASKYSYGMVVVSGPTGSGKSTTLYSLLRAVDYIKRNVVTVEDPIEYKFNFIYQTEVNEAVGYKFSTALRYLMRQDPDVILIGEIRDEETANISVSAANTGHLLLTTVHANDALTTVYRLLNLCEDKDIALSVIRVISAQRLYRKLCPFCKEEDSESLEWIKKKYPQIVKYLENKGEEIKVYKKKGCDKCRGIGYIGRSLVSEVLPFDVELIDAFLKGEALSRIKKQLKEKDFWTLEEVGMYKILKGETDLTEIMRVIV